MSEDTLIGHTVKVRDIRSPKMIVVDQIEKDGEVFFNCLWFDDHQIARHIEMKGQFLERSNDEAAGFHMIPMLKIGR